MDAAVGAASPPIAQERGWRGFLAALAAMLAVTAVDAWPPSLALPALLVRWALPVEEVLLLVLAGLAANALVAWRRGGPWTAALGWSALLLVVVRAAPLAGDGYGALARGWTLLLGGAFGVLGLWRGTWPFLARALGAVGVAAVVTLGALGLRGVAAGGPVSRALPRALESVATSLDVELARRQTESLSRFRDRLADPAWVAVTGRLTAAGTQAERAAEALSQFEPPVGLVPGLLGLESLAALALAWAAWHRLSRTRVGVPLGALSAFRFSDHLVWGVVAGAALVLPALPHPVRLVGAGCLLFFGTLHVLRGVGVLVWWLPERRAVVLPLLLLVGLSLFSPVAVLGSATAALLLLGLGDTWRDLRRVPARGG